MFRRCVDVNKTIIAPLLLAFPAAVCANPIAKLLDSSSGIEKMLLFLAVPATLLFLIMAIMTFGGFGADGHDVDGDAGGEGDAGDGGDMHGESFSDSFHVFTIRNFIVFFMMFGWSGLAMLRSGATAVLSVAVAAVIGAVMIFIVSYLFFVVARLAHSGNISTQSAVGASGTVYLAIPASRSGTGKVNVVVDGSKLELKAMTGGEAIATGESVTVVSLAGNEIVMVERS